MKIILTFFAVITSIYSNSQDLPTKPSLTEIRGYNQFNIMKLSVGMLRDSAISNMGGIKNIQSWYCPYVWCRKNEYEKGQIISNPYSRDLKLDTGGVSIEILWYYTDIKSKDGGIRKDELTPLIFENNKLIGMGWGYYEDYAKRKELNINVQ